MKLVASLDDAIQIGHLTISLDGEGDGAPGQISSLNDLARLINPGQGEQGIVVNGQLDAFESFANIGPEQIFQALQFIIDQLRETGRGGAFDRQLPLVNKSVSELVDLGEAWSQTIGSPDSANSVATAKGLENFLNDKLGTDANPDVVDVTVRTGDILFDFHVGKDSHHDLPLAFSVGNSGVGLIGNGNISLNACADMDVRLGISTAADVPFAQRVFLDASPANEVSLRVQANAGYQSNFANPCGTGNAAGAVNLAATVGPLALNISQGRALLDLTVGADLSTAAQGGILTLANLSTATLTPTFNGTAQAILPLDGNGGGVNTNPANLNAEDALIEVAGRFTNPTNLQFQFNADPASASGDLPHHADPSTPLTSTELNAIASNTVRIVTHNLDGLIESKFLNFGTIITGLEQLLEWGQGFLGLDVLDFRIPFIGKSLRDGLNFLESDRPGAQTLSTIVSALITDGEAGLRGNASTQAVRESIGFLPEAMRKLPGIRPIMDLDGDGLENQTTTLNGKTVLLTGDDLVRIDEDANGINGVTFFVRFNPGFSVSLPFDLGLDFLKFQASGSVMLSGNLDINLGFGINRDDGFFIDTTVPGAEFGVSGVIAADVDLAAKFGFLDVMASLDPATNYMTARFSADLDDGADNDGKLTLDELLDLSKFNTFIPEANRHFEVEAHLNAALTTSIGMSDGGTANSCAAPTNGGPPPDAGLFPTLTAILTFDWAGPVGTATTAFDPNLNDGRPFDLLHLGQAITPSIGIHNAQLDVGSFLDRLVQPMLQKIQAANLLPPSLIDFMNGDLPVLEKTPRELLTETLTDKQKKVFDFVFELATLITDTDQQSTGNLKIQFGDITISQDPQQPDQAMADPMLEDNQITTTSGTPGADKKTDDAIDIPGSGLRVVGPFLERLGNLGIFFPVLRLSNLAQLIVGNDIDLVFIDVPTLELSKEFGVSIPLVGASFEPLFELAVTLDLSGGFDLTVNIAGGFDTTGLRNGRFLDGFYLGDFDPDQNGQIDTTDVERPEIDLTGFVQAAVTGSAKIFDFDIAEVSGFFRIEAGLHADLNDDNQIGGNVPTCDKRSPEERHDGKLHVDEIKTIKTSHGGQLLSILDIGGDVNAELGLHVTVLGGFLFDRTYSWEFPLASFELSFPVECPPESDGGGDDGGDGNQGPATVDPTNNFELDVDLTQNDQPGIKNDDVVGTIIDANGDLFDGQIVAGFDPDELLIEEFGEDINFNTGNLDIDLDNSNIDIGQGVMWEQDGIPMNCWTVARPSSRTSTSRTTAFDRYPRARSSSLAITMARPSSNRVQLLPRHDSPPTKL